jgi:hypothetical protein
MPKNLPQQQWYVKGENKCTSILDIDDQNTTHVIRMQEHLRVGLVKFNICLN